MKLELNLFIGTPTAIRQLSTQSGGADMFVLPCEPSPQLAVMPLNSEIQDALHRSYGTGDWLEMPFPLSTGDLAFCAKASVGERLGFLYLAASHADTDLAPGFDQHAAAWRNGQMTVKPQTLSASERQKRPRPLWPANVVLKDLGIVARAPQDALQASGLADFASNDDLITNAPRLN